MWHLIKGVIEKLSGKGIILRMEIPEKNVRGRVLHLEDGRGLVYISPLQNEDEMLEAITHEAQHLKKDFQNLGVVSIQEAESREEMKKMPGFNRNSHEETRADLVSQRWFNYAKQRGNDLESWLFALLEMKTT